jgi:hypothetical protein
VCLCDAENKYYKSPISLRNNLDKEQEWEILGRTIQKSITEDSSKNNSHTGFNMLVPGPDCFSMILGTCIACSQY